MTKADKELLLQLACRTAMFIHPLEASSAVNFIEGYAMGSGNKCKFIEQLSQLLTDKYKLAYGSDGWPGQVSRLAKRRSSTWLITFRRLVLEVIATEEKGCLAQGQQAILKSAILSHLKQLDLANPHYPQPGSSWVEAWLSLCSVKSTWFRQLWTSQEWTVIKAIDKWVQAAGYLEVNGQPVQPVPDTRM